MAKKKKKNGSKGRSAMTKVWNLISGAAGAGGFVSGVVKADIDSSTTFAGRDTEGKIQHIADVFLGRTIGWSPFGIATKTRKLKPLNLLNTSTFGAALSFFVDRALQAAPSFPYKPWVKRANIKAVFPYLLGQGVGKVFDPPAASPAGTGRITSRIVETERGLN